MTRYQFPPKGQHSQGEDDRGVPKHLDQVWQDFRVTACKGVAYSFDGMGEGEGVRDLREYSTDHLQIHPRATEDRAEGDDHRFDSRYLVL